MTTSVLPPASLDTVAAANTPPPAAKFVLIYIVATELTSSNVPAANCEPPLNPNQPNQSTVSYKHLTLPTTSSV